MGYSVLSVAVSGYVTFSWTAYLGTHGELDLQPCVSWGTVILIWKQKIFKAENNILYNCEETKKSQ